MINKLLIALVVVAAVAGKFSINMIPHTPPVIPSDAPTYSIDLNDPPKQRWKKVAEDFKGPIQEFVDKIISKLPVPDTFYDALGAWGITQKFYRPYIEELQGIGQVTGTMWEKLFLANFIYDISSIIPHPDGDFCTSIVCKDADGKILHGRNLDFWPWGIFSKNSANIKVYRGDKYICEFQQLIGAVMVLSGMKGDSYSITVDTRKFHTPNGIEQLLDNIFKNKYIPPTYLVRETLQNESFDYEQALDTLLNTDTTSPIYYIIGGLVKGSVIEKQPIGYKLHEEITPETDSWYIVQTNYDVGENQQPDERKYPAEIRMNAIGQENMTIDKLYGDVITQFPNFNIASIYTTLFIPSEGKSNLTLWYGNITDFSDNEIKYENDAFTQSVVDQQVGLTPEMFNELIYGAEQRMMEELIQYQ